MTPQEQPKKAYLWVVEMLIRNRWEPTVDVSFSRDAARERILEWREDNPDDRFRIRYYARRTDD